MEHNSNWRGMFDQQRPMARAMGGTPPVEREDALDDERDIDLSVYQPWVLQRGRGRPAMMLDLKTYDAKSGFWIGWAIAYPQLAAVEYVGDRMLSLDFGPRKFVLEGAGLSELVTRLQQGVVLSIQEFAERIWPRPEAGPIVTAIRRAGAEPPRG